MATKKVNIYIRCNCFNLEASHQGVLCLPDGMWGLAETASRASRLALIGNLTLEVT